MSAHSRPPEPQRETLDATAHLDFLRHALEEDEAFHDLTTALLVGPQVPGLAEVRFKEAGVLCGGPLLEPLFRLLDPEARVELLWDDGTRVAGGAVVARVHATARALLSGERTALNLLQRLSGVATHTAAFVEATLATGVDVMDTRKTTPGLRQLEKYAVRCGGGKNHRLHLADAAMIKENHLQAAYGAKGPDAIRAALRTLLAQLPPKTPLYVEVETLEELDAALSEGAARGHDLIVMLDDFDLKGIRDAVARLRMLPPPRPRLEITGGVRLETLEALAASGAHRVSSGRLTNAARALDISLKLVPPPHPTS